MGDVFDDMDRVLALEGKLSQILNDKAYWSYLNTKHPGVQKTARQLLKLYNQYKNQLVFPKDKLKAMKKELGNKHSQVIFFDLLRELDLSSDPSSEVSISKTHDALMTITDTVETDRIYTKDLPQLTKLVDDSYRSIHSKWDALHAHEVTVGPTRVPLTEAQQEEKALLEAVLFSTDARGIPNGLHHLKQVFDRFPRGLPPAAAVRQFDALRTQLGRLCREKLGQFESHSNPIVRFFRSVFERILKVIAEQKLSTQGTLRLANLDLNQGLGRFQPAQPL